MNIEEGAVTVAVDAHAKLGEGAIWDDRRAVLYWVDIAGRSLNTFDPAAGTNRTVELNEQVSTVVPTHGAGVIVGLENGIAEIDPTTGDVRRSVELEADMPENRCNDGKCDPAGRFWIGTMSTVRREGSASLYVVEPDFAVRRAFGGVTTSNGIVWSADRTQMYYIDTPTRRIDVLDYDHETGHATNRRELVAVPDEYGKPDGMTIDSDGRLWVAMFHGAAVTVWDSSTGEFIQKIDVPAKNITSVAFGGESLSTLFITSASIGMSDEDGNAFPHAGALFSLETEVTGLPAARFGTPPSSEADTPSSAEDQPSSGGER